MIRHKVIELVDNVFVRCSDISLYRRQSLYFDNHQMHRVFVWVKGMLADDSFVIREEDEAALDATVAKIHHAMEYPYIEEEETP